MISLEDKLFKLRDNKYQIFQSKLIPNIDSKTIIGVKTPELKLIAKELIKSNNYKSFLNDLPHKYFEENQIHAFIISEIKDYDECIYELNKFLPYVDNWATSDQMLPKVFKNNLDKLILDINNWINSKDSFTIRFGIGMLRKYFLDDYFRIEYLEKIANIKSDDYYVNMMISWYFATALDKQYDSTIKYITDKKLDKWILNKTIQKAIESNCIDSNTKDYLRKFKVN